MGGWPWKPTKARYRVDEFRRVIPKVGATGRGLVQFWGAKATSQYDPDTKTWSDWEFRSTPDDLHTVEIGDVLIVSEQRRRGSS